MSEDTTKKAKVVNRKTVETKTRTKSVEEFQSSGSKQKTTTKLGTYQALWGCASCGKKDNKGLEKICPECGSPKEDRHNEIYYFDKEHSNKLSEKEMSEAGISADHNSDHDCKYCGATLKPNSTECPLCGGMIEVIKEKESTEPVVKSKMKTIGVVIAFFIVFLLCALSFSLFGDRNINSEVKMTTWTSSIDIEEYKQVEREGWELPDGSEVVRDEEKVKEVEQELVGTKSEEVCETKSVISGYEEVCSTESITYDDGTSDLIESCESEPIYEDEKECHYEEIPQYEERKIYETWYTYTEWDWIVTDTKTMQGNDDKVQYPEFEISGDGVRKGDKNVEYQIYFLGEDGEEYVYKTTSHDEFKKLDTGSNWEITIDKDTGEVTEKPKKL